MTKKIYKVTLYGGYIGLISAVSLEEAKKKAMSEQGSANVQMVARASDEDIQWVKAMGGFIPDPMPRLPSEWAKKGYYIVEGCTPKPGMACDYYDREGNKHHGTIKSYDGESITIAGERTVIVVDTFKVKHGR